MITPKRRAGVSLGIAIAIGAGAVWFGFVSASKAGSLPSCISPSELETFQGVTLQSKAMQAFKSAEQIAGRTIGVVQSYRSCTAQALACRRICGDPGGCAGTCAEPGTSSHQRGEAVDVAKSSLDAAGVAAALRQAGWCESVPESDPGHFSYHGCH